jgi:uncharacterized membrane protein YraQ (UPF0718 family)
VSYVRSYLPPEKIRQILARRSRLSGHFLAALFGVILYSGAAGVIPLVGALTEKGVAMGTTLAFMMAVTALSLPEFMILKKIMTIRLIMIFAAVVGLGIIFTGYLINYIL